MKLIHLGDLHIGKRVNGFSMLEDQRFILEAILRLIREQEPDGVLLAGDLYDKSVPTIEAVQLFDWFLTELVRIGEPVYMISGNHDSPERIAFGSRLMQESGVYVSALYPRGTQGIRGTDEYGEYFIYLLPFLKPAYVRNAYREETTEGYQPDVIGESQPEMIGDNQPETVTGYPEALRIAVEKLGIDPQKRNILLAHQFVAGAESGGSEELSVGGLDQIGGDIFADFDYVALGHIHRPQNAGRTKYGILRYCGSPLKYSFSETEAKSVTVMELGEKGSAPVITRLPLKPLRDMRRLRGSYAELTLKENYQGTNTDDYVHVTLTDEEDVADAVSKLRIVYPNLMQLDYDNTRTRSGQEITVTEDSACRSDSELFAELYEWQNNQKLKPEQEKYIQQLMQEIQEGKA